MLRVWIFLSLSLGIATCACLADSDTDFFDRQIRPVLLDKCISCHGPDVAKAGLRLDSRLALLKGSESGPVVTPGRPGESPLIDAIRRTGDVKMPPKQALPPGVVADFETWVKMNLPWTEVPLTTGKLADKLADDSWRRHWAFREVRNPSPPAVKDRKWSRTSIDPFLLKALEAKGLNPSKEADRVTLIRRASYDLLGLPPTPEEVEAFRNDRDSRSYEHLIDRLLASNHYGERWGRHWLDVARYADTKGYVFFEEADFTWAYTYRDYVIRALNEDLPYDQFLIEQLAADLLSTPPGKSRGRTLAALGFLSLGGRFMNNPHDIIDDRIDVVTRGLMGFTVTCARCHDHKYDPIPTADYYALHGVFASTTEPSIPPLIDEPPTTPTYQTFAREMAVREQKLGDFVKAKHDALVNSSKTRMAEYLLAAQAAGGQPNTEDFMLVADGGDLNPTMLLRWRGYLERTRRVSHPVFIPWHALIRLPEGDFAQQAAVFCSRLISNPDTTRPTNAIVANALATSPPKSLAEAARIYAKLVNSAEAIGRAHVQRARLNRTAVQPLPIHEYQELWDVFHEADAAPMLDFNTVSMLELLPDRASQAELQTFQKAVETWRATGPGAPPRAMAVEDLRVPVQPRIFVRGNPNNLGPAVPRRFLTALSTPEAKPFAKGSGRLELARLITSNRNPLTARVLVNRVWMHHFGSALVATPSDFGLRSEPPTHPDLLDHLAYTFMHDDHWSLKSLHRRIMLSAAYRQRSEDRLEARAIDPENSLLWRMNRRRLELEILRDAMLAVSGKLDPTIGGPSFNDISAQPTNPSRRTLYGKIDRLNLPGLFRTFDFPDPNATSAKRDTTTISPQALFLMNNPFVLTCARSLAQRSDTANSAGINCRVDRLYRYALGRSPKESEIGLAQAFVNDADGGWDRYAQTVLISNEFAFVD